jgi:hypothetical protein
MLGEGAGRWGGGEVGRWGGGKVEANSSSLNVC